MVIFTIGHSVHPADVFLNLLRCHGIRRLADVRTIPRSRRHPHFEGTTLQQWLGTAGVTYRHFPDLGGLRRPRPDSVNTGWAHPGFRGYADHMRTASFSAALEELMRFGADSPAAVMCAEARWWQCHRRLLADALLSHGVTVRHILAAGRADAHEMTPFARVHDQELTYPGLI